MKVLPHMPGEDIKKMVIILAMKDITEVIATAGARETMRLIRH